MGLGIVLIVFGIVIITLGIVLILSEEDSFALVMLIETIGVVILVNGIGICGSAEAQSTPQNSIYCVQCGDSVEENYIYCPDCGTKIVYPE